MTCREFAEFLDAYLERTLSPAETDEFERHLAVCPHCVAYLDNYRATVKLGRAAFAEPAAEKPIAAPEDLIRAILAARKRT